MKILTKFLKYLKAEWRKADRRYFNEPPPDWDGKPPLHIPPAPPRSPKREFVIKIVNAETTNKP